MLSFGQRWVTFGAMWNGLLPGRGQFLHPSNRGHPCSTTATKPLPCKPNTSSCTPEGLLLQRKKACHHTARCERPKVGLKSYPSVSVGSGDGEWSLKYFSKAVPHVAGQRTSSSRGMWRYVERPGYLHEQQLPRVGSDWSPTK